MTEQKTRHLLLLVVISLITLLLSSTTGNVAQAITTRQADGSGLFAASDVRLSAETDTTVTRSRAVTVDFDAFTAPSGSGINERLTLNLFDGTSLVAILDRLEYNPTGGFTWIGRLQGEDVFSLVTLVVNKDVLIGKVAWLEGLYEIRFVGGNVHKIVEINQAAFGEELPPIDVVSPEVAPADPVALSAFDDGAVIDVLVLYTPEARAADGGTTAIENRIILAVSETNTAYANSQINQRLSLVYMEETVAGEALNDFGLDLAALRHKSDGKMDSVHALRDTYHADNVVLIIENVTSCGLAYRMATVSTGFEDDAFGVVQRTCATGIYSFGHELGHNMSAHHDWYVTTDTTPWTYVHGYVNLEDDWRTIMAYTVECVAVGQFCPKIPYFSVPAVSWNGDPIGVPAGTKSDCVLGVSYPPGSECDADVQLALNNTAATTDQFRTSQYTWVGNSSDWNTATNWTTQEGAPGATVTVNRVPRIIDDIVIPSAPTGGSWPTISGGTAAVRDVIIETGAQLTLSGGTLTVYGNWQEQGTGKLIATGGDIVFAGFLDTEVTTSADSHFPQTTFGDGSTRKIALNSAIDINGDVTFAAGTTTSAGANTIEVGGDWSDNGGFSADTSLVVFDTAPQSAAVTSPTFVGENFNAYTTCCGWGSGIYIPPTGWSRQTVNGNGWLLGSLVANRWSNATDGWLFTNSYALAPNITYELSYDAFVLDQPPFGTINPQTLTIWLGTTQSSGSMTQLIDTRIVSSTTAQPFSAEFTVSSTGTYYIGFRATQTIEGDIFRLDNVALTAEASLVFNNLDIGSPATSFSNQALVLGDLNIQQNGMADLGTNDVAVAGTVINNGAIRQTASPVNGSPTHFLTIKDASGTIDKYRGVTITPTTGNMGSTAVTVYGGQDCTEAGLTSGLALTGGIQRCYNIVPTTPQTADVTFYFRSAELNSNIEPHVFHYLGTENQWEQETFSARDTGSAEASYVTATGIDNYSPFAVGDEETLPVTLAYVHAAADTRTTITWQTATETGTVGFNLYGVAADGSLVKLTERVTLATGVATVVPQTYRVTVPDWGGDTFYIEDIGIRSETDRHGPFTVGQPSGRLVEPTPIDWPTIHTQHATRAADRQATLLDAVRQTFTPSLQATPAASIDVLVSRTGLQRITYADLVAFGIDPAGLPANRLALLHNGQPVPVTVLGGNTVGPNTVIEFLGEALDSLYTATNVYSLTVNPAEALRVGRDTRAVPPDAPVPFYLETVTVEEENTYSYLAPNGDPWYSAWMMAYGGAYSREFTLPVDHLTTGADAVLHLDVWGLTDWPSAGDDHRLQVSLNGTLLADVTFDGLVSQLLDITLPAGLLAEGDNTLTLTVPQPADPDVWWDIVILDSYGVTYPRAFVAVDNSLTFTAAGAAFEVDGLTALDGAIYRVAADGSLARLARAVPTANGDGTYRVKFRGSPEPATYYVSSAGAMTTPALAAAQPFTDITSGSADYLMLAHPDFIDGLTDLATHHATRGLTVKIVDVTDVYAQFSFGVVDPLAIQEYIEHAVTNMGVQYVLLVGGDTYDYFDRLGLGSISFIPSLYGPTEPYVSFAPLDPLYADVDGDGVPDVPIGRFPVRTPAELTTIIAKTLAYANAAADQSVLLAADDGFKAHSDSFAATLAGWSTTTAYLDDVPAATARQTVLDTVNGGVRLTSFLGHSGPVSWTYDGLFSAADAASLTNAAPTVVTQWGCWNTYHVEPLYNTLGHEFMLNEAGGAAAVLGAATLTQTTSDMLLGVRVLPEIVTPGQTLGDGIQAAKADLALTQPGLRDVLLGWTLLGDPALTIQP